MKLIDLLVQHLNSNGGWPIGAGVCAQDNDGEVCFYTEKGIHRRDGWAVWSIPEGVKSKLVKRGIFFIPAEDMVTSVVCREQYESALAASQQTAWNGEGLPPVGCECELFDCENWNPVIIKFVGEKYVVTERIDLGYEVVYCVADRPDRFRPRRSEAERKRDKAIAQMMDCSAVLTEVTAGIIYDAIAAGEVAGIKLDGDA